MLTYFVEPEEAEIQRMLGLVMDMGVGYTAFSPLSKSMRETKGDMAARLANGDGDGCEHGDGGQLNTESAGEGGYGGYRSSLEGFWPSRNRRASLGAAQGQGGGAQNGGGGGAQNGGGGAQNGGAQSAPGGCQRFPDEDYGGGGGIVGDDQG